MVTVLSVVGTRPEAIKMAPVVLELARCREQIKSVVCVTGQHREMLAQVLELFSIVPDVALDVMQPNQRLSDLSARLLQAMIRWSRNSSQIGSWLRATRRRCWRRRLWRTTTRCRLGTLRQAFALEIHIVLSQRR